MSVGMVSWYVVNAGCVEGCEVPYGCIQHDACHYVIVHVS